ncbi:flagellar basal-body MS-ring/collar protein FliF [Megalodesulfovibrio gigas]|uniref:Flagellar M-ring protein n=1 Tax=Megalodesulfovibrio gigas (strain ATCC 19364 / DSM 1382 / NCIMB 9332 / VKM B-1759) TaxID=1121448 RepID=T2G8A2_MEGG1|nr:flagellar basal-body MS-ring/collar protein FliF [Megalodesulfovibrio gigas]AGW12414.1 putative flagellar M-ring protein FliF [Megalodesulfovibrio gigas DSM 1382 = ATCC 19364]
MANMITTTIERFKGFWARTNVTQRVFLAGLTVAVVAAFMFMLVMLNQPNMKVLYTQLAPEDANRIVEILKAEKVKYSLVDNGATVMVPEALVYDLRLRIAGEGAMVGQGVGFEIFDELKMGQTDFVQKINYQRALQGELARTIMEFPEIEKARVHLVIPKKSLFIEEEARPSASIVLQVRDGKKLDQKQVQSVVNLVAMAVEGLDKDKITVTDTRGQSLFAPSQDGTLEGLTTTQLSYKQTMERSYERRIEEMLAPVVGTGKVIAKVNADLDFSQRTIRKESWDPEKAVIRSEQRSEESTQGRANTESGVPEANFRGDGITGALSTQESNRETRTTNYEINKEEQSIVAPVGELSRLTVAVIVDGMYEKGEGAETYTFVPRSEEEMARFQELVKGAVGYESSRGDTVQVNNISFGGPEIEEKPSFTKMALDLLLRNMKTILSFVALVIFVMVVVRPVILALIRPSVTGEAVEGLEGLPEGEQRLALMEGDSEELEAMDAMRKIEDIKAHAMQLTEQHMEQAVNILRNWIKDNEPARI